MFPKIDPTTTQSWSELISMAKEPGQTIMELLRSDANRVSKFSFDHGSIYFDFSKNSTSDKVLAALLRLAKECQLTDAIGAMFDGDEINETESRAVLHTELRRLSEKTPYSDQVQKELKKIQEFSSNLIEGQWKGYSRKQITDVVNIGIGGSDLGPKMVTHALHPYWKSVRPHFVSNVDAQQLVEELTGLNPETTLFIIASKTFITQETMTNAESAKSWFLENGGSENDISKHFVGVSTNRDAVESFGIDSKNMFEFWDWVGGRYSLWSSIGLVTACTIGFSNFEQLLLGAEDMDLHFKTSPFEKNMPVLAALIGIWYNNFLGHNSLAILPYDHRLRFLPSYLQQADMESNGKSIDRLGRKVCYQTGPIIWGEPGTNGQHAFYQLIHQGTKTVPCDFIMVANPAHEHSDHHQKLLANFLAQPEALLTGKSKDQVVAESEGSNSQNTDVIPFKVFEGNRPTTSILIDDLTPLNLGKLVSFYEHKIFVQGVIWNIFSFDQWGVELGKQLAKPILEEVKDKKQGQHDNSTTKLMEVYQRMRK
ncbi:MAG: glucose-6-phosphate isomerase [Cyclobacteriaceae bacterium]